MPIIWDLLPLFEGIVRVLVTNTVSGLKGFFGLVWALVFRVYSLRNSVAFRAAAENPFKTGSPSHTTVCGWQLFFVSPIGPIALGLPQANKKPLHLKASTFPKPGSEFPTPPPSLALAPPWPSLWAQALCLDTRLEGCWLTCLHPFFHKGLEPPP